MNKLLHLIASPREEQSRTLQVSRAFLEEFKQTHPDWVVEELNLTTTELPTLSMKRLDGKYVLLEGKDLFGDLKDTWKEILQHIERFLSADCYLLSTPMWNFLIPYMLKHYIDLIVQPKYTFRYLEDGKIEGLAKNKKMIVITSRGGSYNSPDTKDYDHQEPYLRMIFGFIGITDIAFLKVEPMDMGEELRVQKLKEMIPLAKKLAANV